jgi:hypothetical protein
MCSIAFLSRVCVHRLSDFGNAEIREPMTGTCVVQMTDMYLTLLKNVNRINSLARDDVSGRRHPRVNHFKRSCPTTVHIALSTHSIPAANEMQR